MSNNVKVEVGGNDQGEKVPNSSPEIDESLRSISTCIKCPTCNAVGPTKVNTSMNILTCLFGYFCTNFYCCYVMYTRKDYNCYNAEHHCGACDCYINKYSSCM